MTTTSEAIPAAELLVQDSVPVPLPKSIKPIPASILASFAAWWGVSKRQTAEAELHLFRQSGVFHGAEIGNAAHITEDGPDGIVQAFTMQSDPASGQANPILPGNEYATVATRVTTSPQLKGKIGCIRSVHLRDARTHNWMWSRYVPRFLHMIEVGTPTPKAERSKDEMSIVLVHGYGAGSAFFFRNIRALAEIPNSRLYALDWLGMGCSSRPPYKLPDTRPRTKERVEASESFMLDALEEWREKMQIEKMVLVGHSLGGYLSTAYALRYPERVTKLLLVSPVGFPEGSFKSLMRGNESDPRMRRLGPRTISMIHWLWDRNVSPFSILRATTVLGPMLMSGYTRRRFGSLDPEELQSLHAYCHGIFTDDSSSEHCLADILAPGAFARYPLMTRIAPLKIPLAFFYGDHDWMDIDGGYGAQKVLQEAGNSNVQVHCIPRAGHHLYLDNAPVLNKLLQQDLRS